MNRRMELYVRHLDWTGQTQLHFHVPEEMRKILAEGILQGEFDCDLSLELSIQPQWIDNDEGHMTIPISSIYVHDT